jgi:hypothetical protein
MKCFKAGSNLVKVALRVMSHCDVIGMDGWRDGTGYNMRKWVTCATVWRGGGGIQ